ncbi:putative protein tag-308, partial [Trichinella spiralis]|uniref:putative protein tag-308 n=1 Tax=Trichinella spiralis TaxID=6334 RepID=UPI0001EFD1FA
YSFIVNTIMRWVKAEFEIQQETISTMLIKKKRLINKLNIRQEQSVLYGSFKNPLCSNILLKIISCGEIVIATFPFFHTYWPLDHLTGKVQCEDQLDI